MTLLIASIVTLLIGPVVYGMLFRRPAWFSLMDGFVFVTMGGLVLFAFMPEAIERGGAWALLFAAAGLLLPTATERAFHRFESQAHLVALVLGLLGLALHAMTDGATLAHGAIDHGNELLSWGVILHRFPIGLTVWWILRPNYGRPFATGALALIAGGTIFGYLLAPQILATLSQQSMGWFQAFVSGSLLHVVIHRPHAHGVSEAPKRHVRRAEGLGNLLGGALLIYLTISHSHLSHISWFDHAGETFVTLALISAPALLAAYVLAGVATAFMPQSYVDWMSAGGSWNKSFRGVVVGLPLPVCSCGVIPLYHTLIRKGAPPAAAMAFLVATPELGIDAVLLSLPLLGGQMTIVRVLGAAIVALLVGVVVGRMVKVNQTPAAESCHSCAQPSVDWRHKLRQGMREGMGELVDHTGPWILVGLVVASFAEPVLGAAGLRSIPAGVEVIVFALLGMPIYVCASGATPIVAVFLMNSISPGAALAFLLTGPATNLTTFGVLSQLHGRRGAFMFGLMVLLFTIVLGYLTNLALPNFAAKAVDAGHFHASVMQKIALALLIGLYLLALLRRGARSFMGELFSQGQRGHEVDGSRKPLRSS